MEQSVWKPRDSIILATTARFLPPLSLQISGGASRRTRREPYPPPPPSVSIYPHHRPTRHSKIILFFFKKRKRRKKSFRAVAVSCWAPLPPLPPSLSLLPPRRRPAHLPRPDLGFPIRAPAMAEAITASTILPRPVLGAPYRALGRRRVELARTPSGEAPPRRIAVRAIAHELTRPRDLGLLGLAPPNKADNPALHNPLLRQERLGCGWISAIFELEGVIVEDDPELERQSWVALSQEEGRSPPPAFSLRRIEGMKSEQAISEVLCWSRDPSELRRLASRKEEIHRALQGGVYRLLPGSGEFMATLMSHKIPVAVISTRRRTHLEEALAAVGIRGSFDAIVTAEDVHRAKPDPEMLVYASQLLNFIPERCIVFGNSNSTVEAAHDARMRCVAVASKQPVHDLGAADLVVRRLSELSIMNLKNLAAVESDPLGEPELEPEEEPEPLPRSAAAVDDIFW